MKKQLFLFLLTCCLQAGLFGQNYDITGLKRINASDLNAIIENNEVKGYYAFYPIDKINKKENLYNLAILDNNLKQTHSVELSKSNKYRLLESSYNGNGFCFSFVDFSNKKVEYLFLDAEGNKVGNYEIEVSDSEASMYSSVLQSDEDTYSGGMVAVKGKGFIRFGYERGEGTRIAIEMMDNKGAVTWTKKSGVTTKKSYESMLPYFTDDKTCIVGLYTREHMMSMKGAESNVVFYNVDNGNEMFRLPTNTAKYQLYTLGANYDENSQNYFIYGQFYGLDDNMAKDDSKGMFMQEVDASGKIVQESYSTWAGEINNIMLKKLKGKYEKNMKVFIHKVIQTADGKLFAVGEQYRKAVSGVGVAAGVLMGGHSNVALMKIDLHDMLTFEFNKSLQITDVYVFEKKKTAIELPRGIGMNDANKLGYLIKLYHWFDYAFTSVSSDRKTFYCSYVNYEKDKEEGSEYTIGNISYTKDQKLVNDKIKLKSNPTTFFVLPGKPGYVAIFEYFRKQKKATIRLEKLNL